MTTVEALLSEERIKQRFFSKFEKGHGCWKWRASCLHGYGQFKIRRGSFTKNLKAHKVAVFYSTGAYPSSDLVVMHSCDNPPCVNPAHLSVGTARQNLRDCVNKQRGFVGEHNGSAVLSYFDVLAIFFDQRDRSEIAMVYSVSKGTIEHIKNGHSWTHVTGLARKIRKRDEDSLGSSI